MNHIVCDTNCIVSGFLWNGAPARIIQRVLDEKDCLFISKELFSELHRVLGYQKIKKICQRRGVSKEDILRQMANVAVFVMAKPLGETVIPNDPADDMVLACAVTAGAEVIVSGDKKHLLPLGSYRGIRILPAVQYLAEVESGETL